MVLTIIELVFAALILVNYLILRVSYFIYYKVDKDEEKKEDKTKRLYNLAKNGEIFRYIVERLGTFLINVIKDIKLIYHLFLLGVILVTLVNKKYKYLLILLIDIIERSKMLMCIIKSFWIPRKQIRVTLVLCYLVAYYFIIFIYLFIRNELPGYDCLTFYNCYFTLCD